MTLYPDCSRYPLPCNDTSNPADTDNACIRPPIVTPVQAADFFALSAAILALRSSRIRAI